MLRTVSCLLLLASSLASAQQVLATQRKLETLLLMPEPKAMRSAYSLSPAGSKATVLTPMREAPLASQGLEYYSQDSFTKLGLSLESFAARASSAADKRLAQLKPDLIKNQAGKVTYAVYRGDSPLFATLLVAPSLPKIFEELFGKEIWVAIPDRHALYIFPPSSAAFDEFAQDLAERYTSDPFAASCEVFALKLGTPPRVVATFAGEE